MAIAGAAASSALRDRGAAARIAPVSVRLEPRERRPRGARREADVGDQRDLALEPRDVDEHAGAAGRVVDAALDERGARAARRRGGGAPRAG